jgi:hypothetical protein
VCSEIICAELLVNIAHIIIEYTLIIIIIIIITAAAAAEKICT